MKKNVVIIEDDFTLNAFLKNKINSLNNFNCFDSFCSINEFMANEILVDILLLDINLPGINGIDGIPIIIKKYPTIDIVMNTIRDDSESIYKALQLGAIGYIDKQSFEDNILNVLESLNNGGAYMTPKIARKIIDGFKKPILPKLTEREQNIVQGILDGFSYQQIGDKYFVSIDTVRTHIKSIYKKLQINSKAQLFKIFKF